ncbi:hypothetical protein [Herbaspirillum robiniae]|uniref:Uncharacterized protein n=1 Tax=Herbaspirillum robiniae TaxID=2014887 RepID=A0ABX2LZ30_9BURK|nr:hypothetical protein [Herbaspirillum robiniae]NUU03737.1 hypothetical protein [Herbaspirillum robiniae]
MKLVKVVPENAAAIRADAPPLAHRARITLYFFMREDSIFSFLILGAFIAFIIRIKFS